MPIQVSCPYCQKPIALAEQQFGQSVECPQCRETFVASVDVKGVSQQVAGESAPPIQIKRVSKDSDARRKVTNPAIGLMVTGALTTLMGLMFIPTILFPGLMGEQVPVNPLELAFSILFMLLSLALGIVTLHGSAKMIQLQSYPLSMAAAIAAMIPWYCCLLGLPMGIWALIVHNDKEVKRAFK